MELDWLLWISSLLAGIFVMSMLFLGIVLVWDAGERAGQWVREKLDAWRELED